MTREVADGPPWHPWSLHVFLRERDRRFALRFDADVPSLLEATTSLADGRNRRFRLLSLPLYNAPA